MTFDESELERRTKRFEKACYYALINSPECRNMTVRDLGTIAYIMAMEFKAELLK